MFYHILSILQSNHPEQQHDRWVEDDALLDCVEQEKPLEEYSVVLLREQHHQEEVISVSYPGAGTSPALMATRAFSAAQQQLSLYPRRNDVGLASSSPSSIPYGGV
mmetsp:Transcript_22456/g.37155  ORF Transcript_22456/g.37155 Transcript_22456/m.37155 type:complete len:106 (+) Transcript_22456:98-415(+)|eukprot:CAMPEP_0119008512 /NCGR_PEP_ID=MMETSP1176-20130426/3749_1 /TAXON_ID=265551 /ORGANISM="Synedropsis recta cf, Strain CCMP1620" /LENGTH=105 /DNA_ID=CAMNT_0006960859 /DNA_START=90 /DNA_END=407 /DNA_ORIENTATION=-